jgi:hypothetical protein
MQYTSNQSFWPLVNLSIAGIGCLLGTLGCSQALQSPAITKNVGRTVAPPPAHIPLSWNDPIFKSARNSGRVVLSSGQSASKLSIVEQSGEPSITCFDSCTLDHIRIKSREGYRGVSGDQYLSMMYVEVRGIGDDHADGLQMYSPGATGRITVKNSTLKVSGAANSAYFSADNWKGSHVLENVLLSGGGFTLRVSGDGGSSVSLKNVYIEKGSYAYGAILFNVVNGQRPAITRWENVRYVTIENGKLVMGDEIKRPY